MIGLATCTVSVYRDSGTSAFGDPTDTNAVAVLTGVPFSLLEQSRAVTRRAADRGQQTRYYTGRCNRGTGILLGDRVKDEATGEFYQVTSVHQVQNPVLPGDQVLDLERTPTS